MTVTLGNDKLLGIAHDLGMHFYPVNFCMDRIDFRRAERIVSEDYRRPHKEGKGLCKKIGVNICARCVFVFTP
jgi:hypothetical protein